MKKTELRKILFDVLTPEVSKIGFKPIKSRNCFRKAVSVGFWEISFHIIQRSQFCELIFVYHIRFDQVENLWHLSGTSNTDEQEQQHTTTVMLNQEFISDLNIKRFKINTLSIDSIFETFIHKDIPKAVNTFFDRYSCLADLDIALNSKPEQPTELMVNPVKRVVSSLIVAHLNNNSNIEELILKYRETLSQMIESIREDYEQLVKFLGYSSDNK